MMGNLDKASSRFTPGPQGLLDYFREFYTEVQRYRQEITHQTAVSSPPLPESPEGEPSLKPLTTDPEIILQRLQALLDIQAQAVNRCGVDTVIARYREAQFAMVALADDIFLYEVSWQGRDVWRENVLEYRLYRTRVAGVRIFQAINRLLSSNDERNAELATIYLLVLHLGFRGGYREQEDQAPLREYLRRLYHFIHGRDPDQSDPERLLIPQAYGQTMVEGTGRRYRLHLEWKWLLVGVIVLQLVVSQLLWSNFSTGLSDAATAVFQAATGHSHRMGPT